MCRELRRELCGSTLLRLVLFWFFYRLFVFHTLGFSYHLSIISCSKHSKKRKVEDECRVLKVEWTEKYFFTDFGVKAACSICHENIAVFKEQNLKNHFQTKHANFGHNLSNQERQKKRMTWKNVWSNSKLCLTDLTSYKRTRQRQANKIAKRNKSFADAEFIKECMVHAVSIVYPDVKLTVEAIPCHEELLCVA